jgi:hypothetical protein
MSGWGEPSKEMKSMKNYWDQGTSVGAIPTITTISDSAPGLLAPPTQYVGNQVADLDYLNQKLTIPTKTESGIDLSLLTSVIKPASVVYEKDEVWDYQHLIIDISHLIQSQKEEAPKNVDDSEPFNQQDMMPFEEFS